MTRNRRILIAALAVVGILCGWGVAKARESPAFFTYVESRPYVRNVARLVFSLARMKKEFDAKVYWARFKERKRIEK